MEILSNQSKMLADLLLDIETSSLSTDCCELQDKEDLSDLVVNCLVKSITKRKKQTHKETVSFSKLCRSPQKGPLSLDLPVLMRTDDNCVYELVDEANRS